MTKHKHFCQCYRMVAGKKQHDGWAKASGANTNEPFRNEPGEGPIEHWYM